MATRSRSFAFLVYPDSAPVDWITSLDALHIPIAISPIHDKDVTEDGELKKAHFHVLINFSGVKTLDQVHTLFDFCAANKEIIQVNDTTSYCRYLCHLDNDEKVQYSPSDIVYLGGFDSSALERISWQKQTLIQEEVIDLIFTEHITEYAEVVAWSRFLSVYHSDFVIKHVNFVNALCKSLRHGYNGGNPDNMGYVKLLEEKLGGN